ncbi:MAG: phosphotransferase [Gammaproteobacteria bacterium]|nr:phosphotransferase [Gammaproteobacteria bacterium]
MRKWLQAELGPGDFTLEKASEDASFRRYFRISGQGRTWIAMDAPPDKEDSEPFLRVATMLRKASVHAPDCYAQDLERGFLLLEDLGTLTYLDELRRDPGLADTLYRDALYSLALMQSNLVVEAQTLPPYDQELLDREMALFTDWLLERHLGLGPESGIWRAATEAFAWIREQVLTQPRVFVHRDYHSRNLMRCDAHNPGVLDFQDSVCGPVTYDLVSLLRDCYISWPEQRVRAWALEFRDRVGKLGLQVGSSEEQFLSWFDLMGLQRHLKASGIFARLWYRDGKPVYMADIPRTLSYIRVIAPRFRPLRKFAKLLESDVLSLGDEQISRTGH